MTRWYWTSVSIAFLAGWVSGRWFQRRWMIGELDKLRDLARPIVKRVGPGSN